MHTTFVKTILTAATTAIVVGFGTNYLLTQNRDTDAAQLEAQILGLETQVADLEAQIVDLKNSDEDSGQDDGSAESTFKFTELGVQITIPESIKDLIYTASSGKLMSGPESVTAKVATSSVVKLDKKCSTSLGALSRVSGQYPSSPNPENASGTLVKQFQSFYIGYTHPQSLCSDDNSVEEKVYAARTTFRNAFGTIVETD